ncbi:hypothetical protein OIV83_005216 [Microbotryomycetes sp. JL201]|nr:hypothetical protein OIV83_005216 [Microbotryomycetes sp. JL201]
MQKDVSTGLMHGSAVFISYVTMLASEIASERGQKTISAQHVLDAVKQLGWDDQSQVVKALRSELTMFRKIAEAKKQGKPVPAAPPTSLVRPYREVSSVTATASRSARTATKTGSRQRKVAAGAEESAQQGDLEEADRMRQEQASGTEDAARGHDIEGEDEDVSMLLGQDKKQDEAEKEHAKDAQINDVDDENETEDENALEDEQDAAGDEEMDDDMPEDEADEQAEIDIPGSEEEDEDE